MKIKKMLSQHRRDFMATYECEHCAHCVDSDGYDDGNFHMNVIPKMECKNCGKVSPDDYNPRATKHHASEVL